MQAQRGRLLIPLFLLVAAMCWTGSVAHARMPIGSDEQPRIAVGPKPHMRPLSGEPDPGQSKLPPPRGVLISVRAQGGTVGAPSAMDQLQWIGRIWMARFLGVR